MIDQKTVREILEAAQVEEVVSDYVQLKRRGSNLIGLCPFHDEKTPSFSVSPAKNIYKCFGCGRAGDSVNFMMEHEQFSFPEALRYLANKYNITIEERELSREELAEINKADTLYGILNYTTSYYQRNLHESQLGKAVGLTYFQSRGLLQKTIDDFQLGFAANDGQLVEQLRKMGYSEDLLKEAGLINKSGLDFFRGRVIFPIHNLSGKPIALAGRVLGANNTRGPKYLNSPESSIYIKNRVLYGMHLAKSHIRKADKCYLVEGYTDVLSLYQNGIQNVVASSGTALTPKQVSLIKRFSNHATLLYDGDAAGIKAAIRGVQLMLQANLNVYIVLFPEGKDPDSYIKEIGHDAFVNFIKENEKDFILFQADLDLASSQNDPIKRAAFVTEMIKTIAFISDPIKRSVYVQELSTLARVDEEIIVSELNKEIKKQLWQERKADKKRQEAKPTTDTKQKPGQGTELYWKERDIIRLIMHGGHAQLPQLINITVLDFIIEQLRDIQEFLHPLYNKVFQEVKEETFHGHIGEYFQNHPDQEIRNLAISIMVDNTEISKNWEEKWDIHLQTQPIPEKNYYNDSLQTTLRLRLERIKMMRNENAEVIKNAKDDETVQKHLEIQNKLIEMTRELANELRTIVIS